MDDRRTSDVRRLTIPTTTTMGQERRFLLWLALQAFYGVTLSFVVVPDRSIRKTWGVCSCENGETQRRVAVSAATSATLTEQQQHVLARIRRYTESAIRHTTTSVEGLLAIEELAYLSSIREPYDFDNHHHDNRVSVEGSVLKLCDQLLPPNVTLAFLQQVNHMCEQGWISTNPDSVDGLPSLHLNLVSGGKHLFSQKEDNDDFQQGIQALLAMVEPYVYDNLLPSVQKELNSTDVIVSDVFLRRYGQDVVEGSSRNGISAHYDVYSIATAVIAMDNVAAEGTNGLYTTESYRGQTSNHAALRRYFPLRQGDGLIHTWDVLHGVNVMEGLDRTSLIVWFSTKDAVLDSQEAVDEKMLSPWLTKRPDLATSDVVQFVMASALESAGLSSSSSSSLARQESHDYYLESASRGNSFALTRIGSLCDEDLLTPKQLKRAKQVAETLENPPDLLETIGCCDATNNDEDELQQSLARQFWLAASLLGNPLAQIALAEDLMVSDEAFSNQGIRVLAAVLCGLAAQQGVDSATDLLSRIVDVELSVSAVETEEDFHASPVVRAAQTALCQQLLS